MGEKSVPSEDSPDTRFVAPGRPSVQWPRRRAFFRCGMDSRLTTGAAAATRWACLSSWRCCAAPTGMRAN